MASRKPAHSPKKADSQTVIKAKATEKPTRAGQASAVSKVSTSAKRNATSAQAPAAKRVKVSLDTKKTASAINYAPTNILAVFVFGSNEGGELGLGPDADSQTTSPTLNPYLDPKTPGKLHVVQLVCGGMHTVALTSDNKLVTWGINDDGALGRNTDWDGGLRDVDADSDSDDDGLNPRESTPTAIEAESFPPNTIFTQVAAGDSCTFALTSTGLVYGWGTFRNSRGGKHFGNDAQGETIQVQATPLLIPGLEGITQITCGVNHALALDTKGRIWAWGEGEQNQLGRRLFGRHKDGTRPRLVEVCRNNAKYIGSGDYHSFAVDHKDNVWAWGLNSFGQAGYVKGGTGGDSNLVPYPMKIRALCGQGVHTLAGGGHYSVAVTAAGRCLVWGRIDGGQLGLPFTLEQLQDESLIRHDERNKPRICLKPTEVPNLGHVVHASCGTEHTIFINQEGKGFSTGLGFNGQLGNGSEDDVDEATRFEGDDTKNQVLQWSGAGGQFSIVAAPLNLSR